MLISALAILVLQSTNAPACECYEEVSAYQQQVRNAFYLMDYIALVEVSSTSIVSVTREEFVETVNTETQQTEYKPRVKEVPVLIARFRPVRVWKGEESIAALETPSAGDPCAVSFKAGSQYLVYAHGPGHKDWVVTNQCTRTTPFEAATRDIATLNGIAEGTRRYSQISPSEQSFRNAMELVHAYSGAGNELSDALDLAASLAQSDPASGFSETILAEALSTWELDENGKPDELRTQIHQLADEALRLNPDLAHAHVAKARAYLRASLLIEAESELSEALTIDPGLESAVFQQAEIYRRSDNLERADAWYRGFIAETEIPSRKSNGYARIGWMYQEAASRMVDPARKALLNQARRDYQSSVDLDPKAAWKLVNFAIFLNGQVQDHDAAEVYAQKALDVMEFPMARYHLAAARYFRLLSKADGMNAASLQSEIAQIAASTRVSLEQAISFKSFSTTSVSRLKDLQSRSIQ